MNAISTLLLLTLPLAAAPPQGPVVVKDVQVKARGKPILVWPGKAPSEPPGIAEKKAAPQTGADGVIRIPYVDTPELIHFPAPANKKNGTCIIVCPGGGYGKLAWNKEGTEVASWLNTLGVEAVALKYRVPRRDREKPHPWPMQDLHRSIRLVRSKAAQWKIDPNRIGVLGFSAGGHLAVMSISQQGKNSYPPIDTIDKIDRRPNFMALIYPAYLGNSKKDSSKLDPLVKVDAKTPPTFISITHDDADRHSLPPFTTQNCSAIVFLLSSIFTARVATAMAFAPVTTRFPVGRHDWPTG